MPVTIPAGLQRSVILQSAMDALVKKLLPLSAFSTAFYDVPLEGNNKVKVPYFPLETSTSKDFNQSNGYEFGDGYTPDEREVTISKRKYQPLSYTSAQLARQPQLNLIKIGEKKGQKLAEDILADVLGIVTASNFGTPVHTGLASAFDFAILNETIGTACDEANWDDDNRSLITKSAYYRNVVSDLQDASGYASSNPVRRGMLDDVAGFDMTRTNCIPDNGENLVGMAVFPSAILVGFSPIQPADPSKVNYQTITHEPTGLTLEMRDWFDEDSDTMKTVIECNYGFAKGEEDALKRIVSA